MDDTKGEFGPRETSLSGEALYVLRMLKNYYKEEGISSEWLFTHKDDKVHDRALDLRIRKYCKELGIKERSCHKMRATYVSVMRDIGMSFEKIAELVGHKSIKTTMENYSYDVTSDLKNMELINTGASAITGGLLRI